MISEKTFRDYMSVDCPVDDFMSCMYRYLIHGLHPGAGFGSILANDLHRSCQSLHVGITDHLAGLAYWVVTSAPAGSFGSWELVQAWCEDEHGRRKQYVEDLAYVIAEYKLRGEKPKFVIHGFPHADAKDFEFL